MVILLVYLNQKYMYCFETNKKIDHKKRYPAVEILIGTSAVKNLIREGKTYQIPSIMQTSKKYGMRMLDDSITDYLHQSLIDAEEAYKYANDKNKFFRFL